MVTENKTKAMCIKDQDFESAIFRFENSPKKKYWWDCLEQIYEVCEKFAKTYILDKATMTIEKIAEKVRKARKSKYDSVIESNGFNITENGAETCYLFRFFNTAGELVCSKVGTTKRNVRQRLIEELNSDTYKNMGAVTAVVDRVYHCGEMPAEGLESLIRATYIKVFPGAFKKNDRFMGQLFDLDYCDNLVKKYLELA